MTSGRGQNVSILQPPGTETWEPPITAFSDTGGSLRSVPRNNSLKIERNTWGNGKSPGQHSSKNSLAKYENKDFGSGNKRSNALISNSASSSSILNSVNRELSPVRWCDREVDGVYLGKSGWVQVQQRSLDDTKVFGENFGSSTLPSRKHASDFESNSRTRERRERSRPVNLPLPTKKHFENHERPSKFIQEFDSVSPPSVTPIISPPPAFKDDGLDEDFPRKTFFCRESEPDLKNSLEERRNILNLSSPPVWSTLKHSRPPYRALHTKSLEDRYSKSLLHNKRLDSAFAQFSFRSLDSDTRASGMVNCYEDPNDGRCDREEPDEYFLQGCDGFNGRIGKTFQDRNYQRNPRRIGSDFGKPYRTRSPSIDSSSSDSSDKSSRIKQSQPFEYENPVIRNNKHFYVKRSRSLQLSERKSPTEIMQMNHSPSGKSWDPMPPEYLAYQVKNQNGERQQQFPQHLDHVLVTVNGESIPVVTNQYLNKITTCEEEQRKLILEAEKEARIISEYLNGTRSRAAARNLLMHRYLNRPEDSVDVPQYDAYSLDRKPQNKPAPWSDARGSLRKRSQTNPQNSNPRQTSSKPFSSFWRTSSRAGSVSSSQNYPDQRKKEQKETSATVNVPVNDRRTKRKSQIVNRSSDSNCSRVEKTSCVTQKHKQKKMKKHGFEGVKPVIFAKERVEGDNTFDDSSSVSSSSSSSSGGYNQKVFYVSDTFDIRALDGKPTVIQQLLNCRPGSAPESDDCTSTGINQRSLSLPRSFLSERYRLNCSNQRELFPWKQEPLETPEEVADELATVLTAEGSRTAPTTPIRDVRSAGKSAESLSQSHCLRSSCGSLLDETSYLNPQHMSQKVAKEQPAMNLNGSDIFLIDSSSLKVTDTPTETQKIKNKFSSHTKTKGNKIEEETEKDSSSSEIFSLACRLISDLQVYEDEVPERTLRFIKERGMGRKGFRNEKYDSHDSGIQMGNRGNVDSSESQDTDLQEDVDSPLAVRRRDSRPGHSYCRPQSEVFNQVLIDKFKADLQWQSRIKKRNYGKGVRRTNSDLGGQRLFNWDAKNHCRRLASHSSPTRALHGRNVWTPPSPDDSAPNNRFVRPQLRRSLSQPLGLNELPPFVRRRSTTMKCFALSEDEKNPRGRNSEDEFLSDSESSIASLSDRKKSFDFVPREEAAILAEAVWDHVAMEACELPFRAGEVIEVLDTRDKDWWWGATRENSGYFPSAFVRLRVSQEDTVEDCLAAMAKGKHGSTQLRRGKSVSLLSNDQVRSSVVRELLNTERDFVKVLRDVKDGYLNQCKRRTDMFTPAQVTTIFSNLEDLLTFQENFLKDLETKVDREFPYKSCVGEVFLNHGSGFRMYSEYCNSHPMAIATLQDLYQRSNYCKFFETCRLKQSLSEIPLDGYLLTPVQRICKYPLQLAELLKYTKPDHPDHRVVEEALETMRRVATLINERKRKMESLEKLAAWQQRVEGWEGEDLIELSSQLIHQGDVVRITSGMWTSNITLFLFDHQIIYCKKDLLKRNVYIYKGRILLDASIVFDLPDGKNQQLGVTVKYGLKITNSLSDKWLLFCCRSSEEKAKWLEALAEEKRVVAQDKEGGLDLPPTAKQLAKMAARTKKCPPCKPRGKNKMAFENDHSKPKPGRRMGTWFTFGAVMKNSKVNLRPRASPHRIT